MKKKLSTLVVLLGVLIYFISPINPSNTTAHANDGNSSTIGGVQVGGLKGVDLKNEVLEVVKKWKALPIVISGAGTTIQLNATALQFDIDATIAQYETLTNKSWYAFWQSNKVVHIPIEVMQNEVFKQEIEMVTLWDAEPTYNQLMAQASLLRSHEIEATISSFTQTDNERIALVMEEIPVNTSGLDEIMNLLNERIISPNEEISFINETADVSRVLNSETINFVASMYYKTALMINGQIVERHSQTKMTEYSEQGIEVQINDALHQDFRFINTIENLIKLNVSEDNGYLKIEVYSSVNEDTSTVRVSRDAVITPRTITRFSSELGIGQQSVVEEGQDGLRVTVYRTPASSGIEEVVSKDYYAPINRIVVKSSRQPVQKVSGTSEGKGNLTDEEISSPPLLNGSDGDSTNVTNPPQLDSKGNAILPKGSYYDKAGNLITNE